MTDTNLEIWVPVISTLITGIFLVIVAKINRENKPVKDLIKKTKIQGDGSLVEALGILQKEYRDSQTRHSKEIEYYVSQLKAVRGELTTVYNLLEDKNLEISQLKKKLGEHERRLNRGHIGE